MRLLLIAVLTLFSAGQRYSYSNPTWAGADGKATLAWCVVRPYPFDAEQQVEAALAEWSRYVHVTFVRGACYGDRTLTFSWVPADHGDGAVFGGYGIAHAFYPAPLHAEPNAGDVHFFSDYPWTPEEIYLVALHEVGHSLGLSHGRNPWGVMYGIENDSLWLQRSDVEAIRLHYARRCFEIECAMRWTP
jgi:predicted Zn-dependent protease